MATFSGLIITRCLTCFPCLTSGHISFCLKSAHHDSCASHLNPPSPSWKVIVTHSEVIGTITCSLSCSGINWSIRETILLQNASGQWPKELSCSRAMQSLCLLVTQVCLTQTTATPPVAESKQNTESCGKKKKKKLNYTALSADSGYLKSRLRAMQTWTNPAQSLLHIRNIANLIWCQLNQRRGGPVPKPKKSDMVHTAASFSLHLVVLMLIFSWVFLARLLAGQF